MKPHAKPDCAISEREREKAGLLQPRPNTGILPERANRDQLADVWIPNGKDRFFEAWDSVVQRVLQTDVSRHGQPMQDGRSLLATWSAGHLTVWPLGRTAHYLKHGELISSFLCSDSARATLCRVRPAASRGALRLWDDSSDSDKWRTDSNSHSQMDDTETLAMTTA